MSEPFRHRLRVRVRYNGDETVAEVTVRHVVVDAETRAEAPIPGPVRAELERYPAA